VTITGEMLEPGQNSLGEIRKKEREKIEANLFEKIEVKYLK